jgi:hydroxymethylpyrimidine pyrophosphatase-like HAD family hydrolase
MTLILLNSYIKLLNVDIKLPDSLTDLINVGSSRTEVEMNFQSKILPILEKKNLLILFDKWSKPTALYLQSAFIESGLGYVYISDYRNFAHGIHNWLNKSKKEVSVLALTASTKSDLPKRTLNSLPSTISRYLLESNWPLPISSLELLIKSMYIVKIKGEQMKIDPGIPNISVFGKKIFNLDIEIPSDTLSPPLILSDSELTAISKKIGYKFPQTNSKGVEYWKSAYSKFIKKIRNNRFKGIVFDYDGTLVSQDERFVGPCQSIIDNMVKLLEHDITIGIATGRGKSVRMDLEKVIPSRYWQNILIGYYNGSDIGYLNDSSHPKPNKKPNSLLSKIDSDLKNDDFFSQIASIKLRDKQLSLEPIFPISIDDLFHYLHSTIIEPERGNVQFLTSAHSIDILLPDVTKLSLVQKIYSLDKFKRKKIKIVSFGDKGRWPGNDFYLLNHEYSLSVNEVSMNPACCWNLSPAGKYGVQAMLYYFEKMQIKDSYVQINLEED